MSSSSWRWRLSPKLRNADLNDRGRRGGGDDAIAALGDVGRDFNVEERDPDVNELDAVVAPIFFLLLLLLLLLLPSVLRIAPLARRRVRERRHPRSRVVNVVVGVPSSHPRREGTTRAVVVVVVVTR